MAEYSTPNIFVEGEDITAEGFNENSDAIESFLNSAWITPDNLQDPLVDDALASPNNAVYRTVYAASNSFPGGAGVSDGTRAYLFGTQVQSGNPTLPSVADFGDLAGQNTSLSAPPALYLNASDYAVAEKDTKLRIRVTHVVNDTAPNKNFTVGLYPVTGTDPAGFGATNGLALDIGTLVAGSSLTVTAPAANDADATTGSDFTFPANGVYALVCTPSGVLATNSATLLVAHLQVHNV